ncbi:MAG: ABC transporter ATP-binding protein [Candidimonas sp.]|nr:MAG: ABC transporter ATP-binding protein [Candidimonas sp.]TAM19140.1 MAG: ABC transporter ATP-binding protein [Candidimonas sp.]TAM76558.1 MAG: ABC transporter ATP-binding protein [Candidimonas sp.]
MAKSIKAEHVFYEYSTEQGQVLAIEDVSFSIEASGFLCVVGPSGCGKTTILNILAGFLKPTQGEVLIGDDPIGQHDENQGVVFQDFAQLYPWRTVRRNVEFGLEMRRVDRKTRAQTANEFLQMVRLEKFADAYPHQLSGGMQQRVAIARALAYNPSVLLMDEPFAALDAMTRDDMQKLLTDIWQETKKTIVYITHNVAEAAYLADKVLIMDPHPGTVKAELTIDIPRPRDLLGSAFIQAQREILGLLTANNH